MQLQSAASAQADWHTCAQEEAHAWDLEDVRRTCHKEDGDNSPALDAAEVVE